MINHKSLTILIPVLSIAVFSVDANAQHHSNNDVIMKAMADELDRSMKKLKLNDLPRPYFIQFNVEDRETVSMSASYGGLIRSDEQHSRTFDSRVRVGSFELDNTNVGRGFGNAGMMPLDDDYIALRHTIWLIVDLDYKQAIETLTAKAAYLKDKNIENRPDDYSSGKPVIKSEEIVRLEFDHNVWKENLIRLSARFKKYPEIQFSDVSFIGGTANNWIVNSEGTQLRQGDSGFFIDINLEIQAADGMALFDGRSYLAQKIDQLPTMKKMISDIDKMCKKLIAQTKAEKLEHYTGPVLFEPVAAGNVFHSLLASRLGARPIPLGGRSGRSQDMEKKLGLRILPRSFFVYDDPRPEWFQDKVLAGSYDFDDEAVPVQKVTIVEKGVLKNLVASRSPSRKVKQTTGHGRKPGFGDSKATIGCLYIRDEDGVSADELKSELIQAAQDEGYEFALRVESMNDSMGGSLGDPVYAYKVSVKDGSEKPVRGMKFLSVETRSLKRLLAAGDTQKVYNAMSRISTSVIAPAILFEELELTKSREEYDKLPFLPSPLRRP